MAIECGVADFAQGGERRLSGGGGVMPRLWLMRFSWQSREHRALSSQRAVCAKDQCLETIHPLWGRLKGSKVAEA